MSRTVFQSPPARPQPKPYGSKETDAENCSCVSVSDKEFARLHSKFGLKKEDVLETIKAYAQKLGLEYGPVNYFMMCDPKYANDLGEIVQ